jgi:hypothetical protein
MSVGQSDKDFSPEPGRLSIRTTGKSVSAEARLSGGQTETLHGMEGPRSEEPGPSPSCL